MICLLLITFGVIYMKFSTLFLGKCKGSILFIIFSGAKKVGCDSCALGMETDLPWHRLPLPGGDSYVISLLSKSRPLT